MGVGVHRHAGATVPSRLYALQWAGMVLMALPFLRPFSHLQGGADIFRPLLQFYKRLLPLAKRRTEIWFNRTDSAGRDLAGKAVHGAFFMETMTQFGTYVPSEKGYHCSAVRDSGGRFAPFSLLELDVHGHTYAQGALFSCPRLSLADVVLT